MSKLIFGCGYLGQRVARRWRDHGDQVVVVTRSPDRAESLGEQSYRAIVADVTRPATLENLPCTDAVLFAIGHDKATRQSIADVAASGVRNVLAALAPETSRFIYISTTGVYGDAGGGWVDEQTQPDPQRDGGRASLAAEQLLAEHQAGPNAIILRLAGIYGPGRVPFLDALRAGEPIPAPSTGYLNLIHVEDAADTVVAASRLDPFNDGPRIYCVSDGNPVQRGDYYREVARHLGAPPPRFVDPDPNSPRAARAGANRRVRNDRMLARLGVKLAYPDYRAGLAALLETQNQQPRPSPSNT